MSDLPESKIMIPDHLAALLVRALTNLDGQPEVHEVTRDGRVEKVVVNRPYRFGGRARVQLAKWLVALKQTERAFGDAHDGLVRSFVTPECPNEVPPDRKGEFEQAWAGALLARTEYRLDPIQTDDLNAESNGLPVSLLAVLSPILV